MTIFDVGIVYYMVERGNNMKNEALKHFNNGKALLHKSMYEQAIEEFKSAKELNYDSWELDYMIAQCYVYVTETRQFESYADKLKMYDDARVYARKALMKAKDNYDVMFTYALCEYFTDNYDNAIKYFEELKEIEEHRELALTYLAHMHSKRRQLIPALKYINQAIKIKNSYPEDCLRKLLLKAEIQYRMGDLDIALKNFMEAHELGDNDKSLCYIAQIYVDKNQLLNAQKYIRMILNVQLDDEDLWQRIQTLTFEELKQILTVFINRYELEEYKKEIDPDINEAIRNKLNPEDE